jgi:hypothetical protein
VAIAPALTIELGADCTHAVNTVALSSTLAAISLRKFWVSATVSRTLAVSNSSGLWLISMSIQLASLMIELFRL